VTGAVLGWPERLGVSSSFAPSPSTEVLVRGPVALDDDGRAPPGAAPIVRAHIVDPASLEARAFDAFAVTADDKPYGVELAVGRGHVILLASDDFLTNAQLARPDDAAAMVTAFAHVGRAEIRMATPEDAIAPPDNPIAGLQRAGLGLFTWHALAAALLAFLAVGSRLTRARPTPPPRRRAFAEHVEATGSFYARAGAASHALAVYARYAEERLWTAGRGPAASSFASAPAASASAGRGSGGGGSDPAAILAARGGASPEEAAGLWARAAAVRAGDGPRGDELQVLKRLSALVTRALGGGNGKAP
jgi:hypothetical protein